jgi:hypothetical protein
VQGDDFTVRGGAADAAIWQKMVYAERLAHDLRCRSCGSSTAPAAAAASSRSSRWASRTCRSPGLERRVDNLRACRWSPRRSGRCAGSGAARVVASHFSVIVRGTAQLFVAGPPVVAAAMGESPDKEELGGARTQTRAGAVDNEAADEDDALEQLKRFLSYLPPSAWELPPVVAGRIRWTTRGGAVSIVPRDPRKPYDMRAILAAVFDLGSVFELGARHGRSLICSLARLDGHPVGVLASDPKHYGGGLTGDASDKLVRFTELCDQFRLPVVNLVDQPGFVIGSEAERAGTMRRGARALFAVHQATVPWVSVLIRKVYGVAGAAHGDASRLNLRYAWPSGDWGSLPIAGGLEAAYRRELEAADDPVALRAEIEARLDAVRSPFRTAERFGVEEIIDPRDTRPLLCAWARQLTASWRTRRGPGRRRAARGRSLRGDGPRLPRRRHRRRRRRGPRRVRARRDPADRRARALRVRGGPDRRRAAHRARAPRVQGRHDRPRHDRRLRLPPRRRSGMAANAFRRAAGTLARWTAGWRSGPGAGSRSSPRAGMSRITSALLLAGALALLVPAGAAAAPGFVSVGSFDQPISVTAPPRDTSRVFVVERGGTIHVVRNGTKLSTPFLDISSAIDTAGERGLLSMTFAPDYATSGLFYLYMVARQPLGEIQIREYRRSAASADRADPTGRIVFRATHNEESNHNGGQVEWGPDGYLWFATGDGGGGDDVHNHARDLSSPLGKVLRIDPRPGNAGSYGIPAEQPVRQRGLGLRPAQPVPLLVRPRVGRPVDR